MNIRIKIIQHIIFGIIEILFLSFMLSLFLRIEILKISPTFKPTIRKLTRKQDTVFNEAFYQLQEHKHPCGFIN